MGNNGATTAYGKTYSVNTGLCGEASRIESIEGGYKYGVPDESRIVVETYSVGLDFYAWLKSGTDPTNLTLQTESIRLASGDELQEKPWWVIHTPTVTCGVPYYYQGYAQNDVGEAISDVLAYTLPCPGAPEITRIYAHLHLSSNTVQFRATVFTSGGNPTRVWFVYSFWEDDYPKSRSTTLNTIPGVNHTEDFGGYPNVIRCGLVVYFQTIAENDYGRKIAPYDTH